MLSFIIESFRSGYFLLRDNLSIFIPVFIFLILEKYFELDKLLIIKGIDADLLQLIKEIPYLSVVSAGSLFLFIKSYGIIYTNTDILLSSLKRPKGVMTITSLLGIKYIFAYFVFSFLWHILFFLIGCLFVVIAYSLSSDEIAIANLGVLVAFIFLFPVYYAGLSVVPFILVVNAIGEYSIRLNGIPYRLIYAFYSLRSIIDLGIIGIIPIVAISAQGNFYVKVVSILLISLLFVAYMRSVSVKFKERIFLIRHT